MSIAAGRISFAADVDQPGLLVAHVVRSPHPRARIVSIDAAPARALPGVVAVVIGDEPELAPERLFGGDTRFVGDRVAVVVAEDRDLAERASEAVSVEYEVLPPIRDVEAGKEVGHRTHRSGPATKRAGKSDETIEGTWRWPFHEAFVVEPPTTLAFIDDDGRLVVRAATEAPFALRRFLARRLGLPASALRVARPQIGAPFGSAEGPRDADLCAAVARFLGRPVRLTEREPAPPNPDKAAHAVRVRAVLRERQLSSLELSVLVNLGASADEAEDALGAAVEAAIGFGCPNLRVDARAVLTDLPPLRMPGRHAARAVRFALEGLLALVGRGKGEDPLEVRLGRANAGEAAVIRDGALAAEWGRPRGAETSAATVRRGLGMATAAPRPAAATAASFAANADGSLTLRLSASGAPTGIGPMILKLAARALGVSADRIALVASDTDSAPAEDFGPAEAFLVARAVKGAAHALRLQLEAEAHGAVTASAVVDPTSDDRRPAAIFAEVEVDTEIGVVRILKLVLSAGWDAASPLRPLEDGEVMRGAVLALGAANRPYDAPAPDRIAPPSTDDDELPPFPDLFAAAAAAVAHAVADAIGVPVLALPVRPGRVLEALDRAREKASPTDAG